jgi:putative nucleotidyltransferase-like protein
MSDPRQFAFWRLALDATAVEVFDAFRAHDVGAVLLKGPSVAGWLYDAEGERPYVDIDVLVAPECVGAARRVLAQLGFHHQLAGARRGQQQAQTWRRAGRLPAAVDLHHAVWGIGVEPGAFWAAVTEHTEALEIADHQIEVLAAPARALLLATHAIQHSLGRKTGEDLRRGVARLEEATWRDAARLAERLGMAGTLGVGLRLVAGGDGLADRLGLPARASPLVHLQVAGAPPTASGFARLSAAASWRARAGIVLGALVPSPQSMRAWQPLARRGRIGLALSYAWRPLLLAWQAPRGVFAWTRARRAAQGPTAGARPRSL